MDEEFSCTVLEADTFQSSGDSEMCRMDDDTPETGGGANEFVTSTQYYAQQVPIGEYSKQTDEYTKTAVEALIASPEYQRIYTRCRLCWCSWSENQYNKDCAECGGFAMTRPCPICKGRCSAIWNRDVDLSHSNMEAYWNGKCCLPPDEREGFLAQLLIGGNVCESDILDGLQDLSAQ